MMMLLMVMPMMTPVMMVIPLVMMVLVVMMIKMFGANTREQAALRRLLISDPKLLSTRPTICISSALINVFSLSANCISSLLKKSNMIHLYQLCTNYIPHFDSLLQNFWFNQIYFIFTFLLIIFYFSFPLFCIFCEFVKYFQQIVSPCLLEFKCLQFVVCVP